MTNKKPDPVVREAERYFGFLRDQGFIVRYADYSAELFGNWVVEYESTRCAVYVTRDRGDIIVELSSAGDHKPKNRISLQEIVYAVSGGREVATAPKGLFNRSQREQLRRMAQVLQKHLPEITLYFSRNAK